MTTGERIKYLRESLGLTQEQLGTLVGVQNAAIYKYENGLVINLKRAVIDKLAGALQTTPAYLMGWVDSPQPPEPRRTRPLGEDLIELPIIGSVRAGPGGAVLEEIVGTEPVSRHSIKGSAEDFFWLEVEGDSMQPKLEPGDLVLVRRQTSIDSGSLAVVIIAGDEGTVKKVKYEKDWIELHSFNPYYPVRRFEGENVLDIYIAGLVMEMKRKF